MLCDNIRVLALDIDGTLLDDKGHISEQNCSAIRAAQAHGVQVVLATGRDYDSIPWPELRGIKIDYVITTNGSSIYRAADRACLFEQYIACDAAAEIFDWLLSQQVYIDVFMDGHDYAPREVWDLIDRVVLSEHVLNYMRMNRRPIGNLVTKLRAGELHIQKGALNFWQETSGALHARERAFAYLRANPSVTAVDGGLGNIEFTPAGTSKATGLQWLSHHLGVSMEQVMAIGDSENDAEMLCAAGFGVAMANAPAYLQDLADATTCSNLQDGVALAIRSFLLSTL